MTLKSVQLFSQLVVVCFYSLNIDCLDIWCLANFMKVKLCKIRVFSFTRYIIVLNYQYTLGNVLVLQSDCVKNLEVHIVCKLIFIIMLIFSFHMQ
jgi:hypothetical protein